MSFKLTWMPDVLKAAGLKVAEVPNWRTRGHGDVGDIKGVLCHHTGGGRHGNMPSLDVVVHGRPDLSGPLCNLGLGRDGTFYIVAAGRAFHAGGGNYRGITNGNFNMIGIEAENTGSSDDSPWPNIQIEAYHHGVAALLRAVGREAVWCAAHKEYALPPRRKDDPDFDMNQFRAAVASLLRSPAASLPLIPAQSVSNGITRETLRRGSTGASVQLLQAKLGILVDGSFGPGTEAKVREFQRQHGLVPDGIVGPKSWDLLG